MATYAPIIDNLLDGDGNMVAPVTHIDAVLDSDGNTLSTIIKNYEPKLTWEDTPTEGSANALTSGGAYSALTDVSKGFIADPDAAEFDSSSTKILTEGAAKRLADEFQGVVDNPIGDEDIDSILSNSYES